MEEQAMRGLMMVRRDIDAIMRFRHGIGIASLLENDDWQVGFGAKRDRIFELKLKRTLANISKVIHNPHCATKHFLRFRICYSNDKLFIVSGMKYDMLVWF